MFYNLICFSFSLDIDECELELDNCLVEAICINTNGSFGCVCLLELIGDGVGSCISELI